MTPANLLATAVGGAIGSVARYLVGVGSGALFGISFPWGTLIINLLGSFILGALVELFALRWNASEAVRLFLTIGICGGFTTFSTFSLDAVHLIMKGASLPALFYILASVILSIAGLFAGLHVLRAVM